MTISIGGDTTGIVAYALDGLALRHATIAANIANVRSAGYRPLDVSFESHLVDLLASRSTGQSSRTVADLPRPAVSALAPHLATTLGRSVEMQTVLLNQNVLKYQSLIAGFNKYLGTITTAINEGRK